MPGVHSNQPRNSLLSSVSLMVKPKGIRGKRPIRQGAVYGPCSLALNGQAYQIGVLGIFEDERMRCVMHLRQEDAALDIR